MDNLRESWVGEEEFLAYAEEQIKKVRETINTLNWVNTGAWGTVVRTVHNLRGSAGMTGHGAVAAILEGLEKKLGQADKYTETQLREEVNASLKRLESHKSPFARHPGESPWASAKKPQGPSGSPGPKLE
jgi:HPt (histidine-containing phosphotransfer) domain-containing protein